MRSWGLLFLCLIVLAPRAAYAGPDLGPPLPYALTRGQWKAHAPGPAELFVLAGEDVRWTLRFRAIDRERELAEDSSSFEVVARPSGCQDLAIHLDNLEQDRGASGAPIWIDPQDSSRHPQEVRIRPAPDYQGDAFFAADPRFADEVAPADFWPGRPYPDAYMARVTGPRLVALAPRPRFGNTLNPGPSPETVRRGWQEVRAAHPETRRCTAVVVAFAEPGSDAVWVRVVARDGAVWAEQRIPAEPPYPAAGFWARSLVTVPVDTALLVPLALWWAIFLPGLFLG